jgi:hypothetical protein
MSPIELENIIYNSEAGIMGFAVGFFKSAEFRGRKMMRSCKTKCLKHTELKAFGTWIGAKGVKKYEKSDVDGLGRWKAHICLVVACFSFF